MNTRHRRGLYAPELLESRIAPAAFVVTSLVDDGSDGAATTLREAIGMANAHPGADTVSFLQGLIGKIPLVAANGAIAITDTLTIKAPGIDLITISGGDMIRIFKIDDGNDMLLHPVSISGLTFIDGKAVGGSGSGGAIYSREPLTLTGVVVASSTATLTGGGVYGFGGGVYVQTKGKVVVTGSQFIGNHADLSGGGLFLNGDAGVVVRKTLITGNTVDDGMTSGEVAGARLASTVAKSTILVDSCTIIGNVAESTGGGLQIDAATDGSATLKNTLIAGNTSGYSGGGAWFSGGPTTVVNSIFTGNSAAGGGGVFGAASLVIKGSHFTANHATDAALGSGGALILKGPSPVSISGSVFSGNDAAVSGGAISDAAGDVPLTISGSLFSGNHAAGTGGAIFLHHTAVLTLTGSTLSGNTTDKSGGALFLDDAATLTLKSSTLSGNIATNNGGAVGIATGALLTATGNKILENRAGLDGGGINTSTNALLTLSGNLISGNVAGNSGGGGSLISTATISMKGDKIIGNTALGGNGGGLYLGSMSNVVLTGVLFQGNHASGDGGGFGLTGNATLTGLKVLGNSAGSEAGELGGGIFVFSGTVAIAKSTVTGNFAYQGGGIYDAGNTTLDAATKAKVTGNSAVVDPNTSGI